MPVKVKIDPLDDWVSITVDETLSPKARSEAVAGFARGRLANTLEANKAAVGGETPYEQFVDGRKGAALESVDPDRGRIVFEFELVNDVVLEILAMLRERSPYESGAYREGHIVFADGVQVTGETLPPADEYAITNPLPYSRRLEIGKTKSGRDFLVSVPNRIYERTMKDARRRFSNIAAIRFTYRGLVGGKQVNPLHAGPTELGPVKRGAKGRFAPGSRRRIRGGEHNRANNRFPTITISSS